MTPLYHPRPKRWPQFTLRGLLVVVTLAALLMPWAIAEYRWWREWRDASPYLRLLMSNPSARPYYLHGDLRPSNTSTNSP